MDQVSCRKGFTSTTFAGSVLAGSGAAFFEVSTGGWTVWGVVSFGFFPSQEERPTTASRVTREPVTARRARAEMDELRFMNNAPL